MNVETQELRRIKKDERKHYIYCETDPTICLYKISHETTIQSLISNKFSLLYTQTYIKY